MRTIQGVSVSAGIAIEHQFYLIIMKRNYQQL